MGCQIFLCQTNDTGCRCHLLEASVVSAVADRFFFRINTCMTNLAACAVSTCYDLAVHDYDDLPLREDANQFVDLLRRPKNVASIGIDAGKGTGQLVLILFLKISNLYFIDF